MNPMPSTGQAHRDIELRRTGRGFVSIRRRPEGCGCPAGLPPGPSGGEVVGRGYADDGALERVMSPGRHPMRCGSSGRRRPATLAELRPRPDHPFAPLAARASILVRDLRRRRRRVGRRLSRTRAQGLRADLTTARPDIAYLRLPAGPLCIPLSFLGNRPADAKRGSRNSSSRPRRRLPLPGLSSGRLGSGPYAGCPPMCPLGHVGTKRTTPSSLAACGADISRDTHGRDRILPRHRVFEAGGRPACLITGPLGTASTRLSRRDRKVPVAPRTGATVTESSKSGRRNRFARDRRRRQCTVARGSLTYVHRARRGHQSFRVRAHQVRGAAHQKGGGRMTGPLAPSSSASRWNSSLGQRAATYISRPDPGD